jgi:hypothetical protein
MRGELRVRVGEHHGNTTVLLNLGPAAENGDHSRRIIQRARAQLLVRADVTLLTLIHRINITTGFPLAVVAFRW